MEVSVIIPYTKDKSNANFKNYIQDLVRHLQGYDLKFEIILPVSRNDVQLCNEAIFLTNKYNDIVATSSFSNSYSELVFNALYVCNYRNVLILNNMSSFDNMFNDLCMFNTDVRLTSYVDYTDKDINFILFRTFDLKSIMKYTTELNELALVQAIQVLETVSNVYAFENGNKKSISAKNFYSTKKYNSWNKVIRKSMNLILF